MSLERLMFSSINREFVSFFINNMKYMNKKFFRFLDAITSYKDKIMGGIVKFVNTINFVLTNLLHILDRIMYRYVKYKGVSSCRIDINDTRWYKDINDTLDNLLPFSLNKVSIDY